MIIRTFATQDITVAKGDTFRMPLQFVDTDAAATFAFTGSTVYFTIRDTENTSGTTVHESSYTSFSDTDNTDDTVTLVVPESDLDSMNEGTYYYSLQEVAASSSETTYMVGRFIVVDHAGKLNPS